MTTDSPQTVVGDPVQRRRMVDEQLRKRGITDERVLQAMTIVPREEFVTADRRDSACEDRPLPIGAGQTISQPYTVAFMCQAALLTEQDKVLEIGTGSGYGAAVLSRMAREVVTIERIPELATAAGVRLERLNYRNVRLWTGDGTLGVPDEAPFDAIIVTAGAARLPAAYVEQLRENGRLVIPIGDDPHRQRMLRYVLRQGKLTEEDLGDFLFVPLIGQDSWSADVDEPTAEE